jgi:hypothetical protein
MPARTRVRTSMPEAARIGGTLRGIGAALRVTDADLPLIGGRLHRDSRKSTATTDVSGNPWTFARQPWRVPGFGGQLHAFGGEFCASVDSLRNVAVR